MSEQSGEVVVGGAGDETPIRTCYPSPGEEESMRCWLKPGPGPGQEAVLVLSGGREVTVRLSRPLSSGPAFLTLVGDRLEILDQTGEKAEADVLADADLIGLLLDWEERGRPTGPGFPVEVLKWLEILLGGKETGDG